MDTFLRRRSATRSPPHSSDPQLELFRRQYLQVVDFELLSFPAGELLVDHTVQISLYQKLFNPDVSQYRPPPTYQLRVLKALLVRIENSITDPEEEEVSDSLCSYLASLLSRPSLAPSTVAQEKSFVTYCCPSPLDAPGPHQLLLRESRALISASGSTGLRTWEAALHLGHFLYSQTGTDLVRGKRVLELGAGTGFVSLLCAKHVGAKQVLATDGDEGVVQGMRAVFPLNGFEETSLLSAGCLRWGEPLTGTCVDGLESVDVVLGADITYDAAVIPMLVATLDELFNRFNTVGVIVSATIRNLATYATFQQACRAKHLEASELPITAPSTARQTGFFYPGSVPIQIIHITRFQA